MKLDDREKILLDMADTRLAQGLSFSRRAALVATIRYVEHPNLRYALARADAILHKMGGKK